MKFRYTVKSCSNCRYQGKYNFTYIDHYCNFKYRTPYDSFQWGCKYSRDQKNHHTLCGNEAKYFKSKVPKKRLAPIRLLVRYFNKNNKSNKNLRKIINYFESLSKCIN